MGFTPGFTGYTRFQGTVPQKIEGSVPSEFYDVIFNNPSAQPAFQLFGEVRINGNSDFFQGIVKDDDFGGLFTFENNATHTNTDNDSHVDGYVQKNGNVAFQYPIGDGGLYRFARIMPSDPNVISDKFTGKYF
ncbi:MAG: gliding motility-associated C-terminal domain-containing protein, partial [Moraxellaceae bacterium]